MECDVVVAHISEVTSLPLTDRWQIKAKHQLLCCIYTLIVLLLIMHHYQPFDPYQPFSKVSLFKLLKKNLNAGKPWVAFRESYPTLGRFDLGCFKSAKDAENFCRPSEYEENSEFEYRSFKYTSIEPILKQLVSANKTHPLTLANRTALKEELANHSIGPNDNRPFQQWIDSMVKGELNAVTYKRTFIPKDEISEYHLHRHLYPRGTVYEVGHGRLPLGSFPRHDIAIEEMQKHL